MTLGDIYCYVGLGTFGTFTFIWLVMCLIQLTYSAYRFVNDAKDGEAIFFRKIEFFTRFFNGRDDASDFHLKTLFALLVGIVIAMCWPVAYPAGIIYGLLLLLRVMVRFKKKVNVVLETKADKNHVH
jgi:hypothetical protein